jgi:hypothetical protein
MHTVLVTLSLKEDPDYAFLKWLDKFVLQTVSGVEKKCWICETAQLIATLKDW